MARPGPLPSPVRSGHSAQADWTDVVDLPYTEGEARDLPAQEWHPLTLAWWAALRILPHAARWTEGDWISALDLAFLKNRFYQGIATTGEITESRKREDLLGFTTEARHKLRIRYVSPKSHESTEPLTEHPVATGTDGTVTPISRGARRRDLQ